MIGQRGLILPKTIAMAVAFCVATVVAKMVDAQPALELIP